MTSLLLLFVSSGAWGYSTLERDLERIREALEEQQYTKEELNRKARELNQEITQVRRSLIDTAKKIQNHEGQVSDLEASFERLKLEEGDIMELIARKNVQISKLLSVLQNLSLRPVETFMAQGEEPVDVLRGSLIMRETIPLINKQTESLKEDLKRLYDVRERMRTKYIAIKKAADALKGEQVKIDGLLRRKLEMQKAFLQESEANDMIRRKLIAQANDIQDLINEINQQKVNPHNFNEEGLEPVKGKLSLPIKGKVIKKYGDNLESGIVSKGILLQGRPNAQVIAPFDGIVVFSGPFRDYKDVLIIDNGGGFHTLLAGMGKNDTAVGQTLLAGEPVGVLPEKGAGLYVEIRNKGQAVDPLAWFVRK